MKTRATVELFPAWSTPLIADACVRLGIDVRSAPAALRPVMRWMRLAGPVRPVRHYGSVDVFLELAQTAGRGEIVVIDNGGRLDEACIGDLAVLELRAAGFAGTLVWGAHRDTAELVQIEWPVLSCGSAAAGPRHVDERGAEAFASARCGDVLVTAGDFVFADDDGVIFVPQARLDEIVAAAREIHLAERRHAERVRRGIPLREQFRLAEFVARRSAEPAHTFRQHVRALNGAIEQ